MAVIKSFFESIILNYLNNPELLFITIILIIFCVLLKIYYPKFRGFMGELWVKRELDNLDKNKYIVLNDIMIKDDFGTHQIDHLVLSQFGFFVIEMKNYYGLIKGSEFDNKWCQYLGKNKNYFINPFYQNYGHIKTLSRLLNIDEKFFVSIVCFSNQAVIKVKSNKIITCVDNLKSSILKCDNIICKFDLVKIADIIVSNNIKDRKIRKQHVSDIHTKINYNMSLENNMICPKCGNELVKRKSKYGIFVGCSNYPKCKYIKK